MKKELTPKEIIYDFNIEELDRNMKENTAPEYEEVYKSIKSALEIKKEGFNVYLVDTFSRDKINNIIYYIENIYKTREKPKDICYITLEDERKPKALMLSNGMGKVLSEQLEVLKDNYEEVIFKFYNGNGIKEKETIMDDLQKKRTEDIAYLMKIAKEKGFDVKYSSGGFVFIPLKEGEAITEDQYESLEHLFKEEILNNVAELKIEAERILKNLSDIEEESLEKTRKMLEVYIGEEINSYREQCLQLFREDEEAIDYINNITKAIEEDLISIYSSSYEEDESKINEILGRYAINVILDNSKNEFPPVIFEKEPSVANLIGNIEYENHNGNYVTDISLINSGSILKANEGCLIIRIEDLVNYPGAYYYLKKAFLNEKVALDYNRGYLELLSLSGLKPEPISINTKLILIGDFATYDLLYSYDEDFKRIFKIKAEYNPVVDINKSNKQCLINNINHIVSSNNLNRVSFEAVREVAKYLSRKAESREKLYFDVYDIDRLLMIADNLSREGNKEVIEGENILEAAYPKEPLEIEVKDMYKQGKILMNLKDKVVGSINALSVTGTSYFSFGRPIRITCLCHKGEGNVIDVHKESDLSGNIHRKAINILKAYINGIINPYEKLPVDFYLSFEQVYGRLDGDSASVAEVITMLSAISKLPIRQNIAVTGSINQFGNIQPIGGINEKIEGFFSISKELDTIENKGVLIPESNIKDLVLSKEVEIAVSEGLFTIYSMKDIRDAIDVLIDQEDTNKDIFHVIKEEIKKYNKES